MLRRAVLLFILTSFFASAALAADEVNVVVTVTNKGTDVAGRAWYGFYPPGDHENYKSSTPTSGEAAAVTPGRYDLGIHFSQGSVTKDVWITDQEVNSGYSKKVELGLDIVSAKITVTNGGQDVGGKAWWGLYKPGERESYLAYADSAGLIEFLAGSYDIGIHYTDGQVETHKWIEKLTVSAPIEKTVELAQGVAHAKVTVTNAGADVGGKAWWGLYKPGERSTYKAYADSAGEVTVEPGVYDIGVHFSDGLVQIDRWVENVSVEKSFEKAIDLGLNISKLAVNVTNNGVPASDKVWWGLYDTGERAQYLGYADSGNAVSVQDGTYDIGVHFQDGAVEVTRWVTNVTVKGAVVKDVELAVKMATLVVHVTRGGKPLPDAWCGIYEKKDSPSYRAEGQSEQSLRIEEGTYAVGCFMSDEGVSSSKWVEQQVLKGKVELNVAMDEFPASFTITAGGPQATNGAVGAAAANTFSNIVMIIDASGSMLAKVEEKKTRMDVAKETLDEVIDGLPSSGVKVELRTYGTAPKSKNDCKDTTVLVPLAEADHAALKKAIDQLKPSGYTPIAYSLEQAASGLPKGVKTSLILVTDGIESCSGDPCAVSARLAREGIVQRSFVVGLGLGPDKTPTLSCIGKYYPARDRAALKKALTEIFDQSLKPLTGTVSVFHVGDRKSLVARGDLDQKIVVPRGSYDLVLNVGGKETVWHGVELNRRAMQSQIGEKAQF